MTPSVSVIETMMVLVVFDIEGTFKKGENPPPHVRGRIGRRLLAASLPNCGLVIFSHRVDGLRPSFTLRTERDRENLIAVGVLLLSHVGHNRFQVSGRTPEFGRERVVVMLRLNKSSDQTDAIGHGPRMIPAAFLSNWHCNGLCDNGFLRSCSSYFTLLKTELQKQKTSNTQA